MLRKRKTFRAPSPKSGKSRRWEVLVELGTPEPYAFESIKPGDDESYGPKDKGYDTLFVEYKRWYPND